MKYSHFYKVKRNPSVAYHLLIQKKVDGEPLYFLFNDIELASAAARAGKEFECIPAVATHPEDCKDYNKCFVLFSLACGILIGLCFGIIL